MQRRFVVAALAAGLLFAGSAGASAQIKIGFHAPQSGRNVEIEALGRRSSPPVGARRITAR